MLSLWIHNFKGIIRFTFNIFITASNTFFIITRTVIYLNNHYYNTRILYFFFIPLNKKRE